MKASFPALDTVLFDSNSLSAAALDELVSDYPPESALLRHLVELAESGDPAVEKAATGLLKRYQEKGATFGPDVVARLLDLLATAPPWEMTLHLLQMIACLPIPPGYADALCDSLCGLVQHRNTFVRAWAYGDLHHLAALYPDYRAEVSVLLARAAEEEPASVRARLRQLPPFDAMPSDV
ncbi:MAG: hypothetical protein M3Y86_03250 [Verrucomicrobiota bacterium]|nr:hypothetical protein [Verrucomicrobiota bacterium]